MERSEAIANLKEVLKRTERLKARKAIDVMQAQAQGDEVSESIDREFADIFDKEAKALSYAIEYLTKGEER